MTTIDRPRAVGVSEGRIPVSDVGAEAPAHAGVRTWALVGAVAVVFMVYVWGKWLVGPFFRAVPSGPDSPPAWMQVVLIVWTVLGACWAVAIYWRVLIRPWRATRRLTTDGALVLAFSVLWFQDPLSNYLGSWFTYNSWLPNMGSWVNDFPGWLPFGKPGATVPEPVLWTGPMYVYVFFTVAVLGCAVMRRARARWPGLSSQALVGVCFVTMAAIDVVLEGGAILPSGVFLYPGGHGLSLFPSTYHKYPFHETVFAASLFTVIASIRFFRNDKGETIAERGISGLRVSERRRTVLRVLATIGVTQAAILLAYNAPAAIWVGAHSGPWPADLQKRSYLTDGLCGARTGRLCPGPAVPNSRGSDAAYVNGAGHLVVPAGKHLGTIVPFEPAK